MSRTSVIWAVCSASLLLAAGSEPAAAPVGSPPAPLVLPLHAGRARPVIAILAANSGTETTDFLIPYGVLSASGVADVHAVSMDRGPVEMMPALRLETPETVESFAARFPDGADYVVIPAVHQPTDAALIQWVRSQGEHGATLMGVCDGVWVLARSGRLEGRTATGHWMSRGALAKSFPGTRWIDDQRYVMDGNVLTTTGVSASVPASLALVALLGGQSRADAVAREIGVSGWSAAHRGSEFRLTARMLLVAALNWLAFWSHEEIGVPISPGIDEVALGLTVDPYSRTYRSHAVTISPTQAPVRTRFGLAILPDRLTSSTPVLRRVVSPIEPGQPAATALDRSLAAIALDYGDPTAAFVALQLEYSRQKGRVLAAAP